ncbi:hypothetical protein [Sulfobacillus harzensis]|uniref:Uncharacterized protein n=1 Tax=Sulfobacillus harzensis TaxID=2729629 RepID=A0A7Y0L6Y2_9FIRM|nr:hypothetical protein [Sulfobacillus harzensis]NMP24148.1 hypothetical protein [Sulfobacillus harzensis]
MMGFRSWKPSQRVRWRQMSVPQQSGWLTGLIALGATMTAVSATQLEPVFWRGFMTGVWGTGTAVLIGLLVGIQVSARHR